MDSSKLVIVGDRAFAEIAYEYFTHDSGHEVVAFTVERDFIHFRHRYGLGPEMSRFCSVQRRVQAGLLTALLKALKAHHIRELELMPSCPSDNKEVHRN